MRWEGTRGKEGEEKERVERITRPCNWLKKRFEEFTTTRKGFAYMKCKGRIEGKKKMEREEEGLAMWIKGQGNEIDLWNMSMGRT